MELSELGRGGFGVVVAAINRLDGRKYAVKKILMDTKRGGARESLLREVSTLSRLQHANVVRYYQVRCLPAVSLREMCLNDL